MSVESHLFKISIGSKLVEESKSQEKKKPPRPPKKNLETLNSNTISLTVNLLTAYLSVLFLIDMSLINFMGETVLDTKYLLAFTLLPSIVFSALNICYLKSPKTNFVNATFL